MRVCRASSTVLARVFVYMPYFTFYLVTLYFLMVSRSFFASGLLVK